MVWTCFKNEQRKNLRGFEHKNTRNMSKRKTEIRKGITCYKNITQKEEGQLLDNAYKSAGSAT
jgi:hypothetical protein